MSEAHKPSSRIPARNDGLPHVDQNSDGSVASDSQNSAAQPPDAARQQKLDAIRSRIAAGYYDREDLLETAVRRMWRRLSPESADGSSELE